jgi:hypothetical protein
MAGTMAAGLMVRKRAHKWSAKSQKHFILLSLSLAIGLHAVHVLAGRNFPSPQLKKHRGAATDQKAKREE